MFGLPGGPEWIVIVLVVLIFFGGKKIPELARGLGKGIREFKEGLKQAEDSPKKEIEDSEGKES